MPPPTCSSCMPCAKSSTRFSRARVATGWRAPPSSICPIACSWIWPASRRRTFSPTARLDPSAPPLRFGRQRRHGARAADLVDGDKGEGGVGHLFPHVRAKSPRPGLDMDYDRSAADPVDFGIDAQDVADLDRANELHR